MRRSTILMVLAACAAALGVTVPVLAGTRPPTGRPDHVLIVVMENKRYDAVIGHRFAPYVNELARRGASFTNAYAETHPSQPNYLALFSGSTQGVTDNRCGHTFRSVPNLGRQLLDAGLGFAGYAEDLLAPGWTGCADRDYVRRHNPWVNFDNVPAQSNLPLRDFPTDFSTLPAVSFLVPGLCHDMHDCPKAEADAWLRHALDGYVTWAETHNSLLILTFDEDNRTNGNHIPTVVVGEHVAPGDRHERIDHYSLLRTVEDWYGLPPLGHAADRAPITTL